MGPVLNTPPGPRSRSSIWPSPCARRSRKPARRPALCQKGRLHGLPASIWLVLGPRPTSIGPSFVEQRRGGFACRSDICRITPVEPSPSHQFAGAIFGPQRSICAMLRRRRDRPSPTMGRRAHSALDPKAVPAYTARVRAGIFGAGPVLRCDFAHGSVCVSAKSDHQGMTFEISRRARCGPDDRPEALERGRTFVDKPRAS